METELVRYSRAGDIFHYRWAARRCLKMIHPTSLLQCVVIEGSQERKRAGEYVIDVTEYSGLPQDEPQEITYFQLKHSTVRTEEPFQLGDLRKTIDGFAKRFIEHLRERHEIRNSPAVSFWIVTNRLISKGFRQNTREIGQGFTVNARFQKTIEKYTGLTGTCLAEFCASLHFADREGDYTEQRYDLQLEMSRLLAGTVDSPQIENITALVQDRVPDSDGRIVREDILKRFGVTSERDLYPAPPELEELDYVIPREQLDVFRESILNASTPVIIHAAGGVGKSVMAHQIATSLPEGSLGIIYDCFGGGRYRNRSEPRHRHRDALVQIANELASLGLCDPLIAQSNAQEDQILRGFIQRIEGASDSLQKADDDAVLVLLIDAADNAEMAATEFSQPCFVHELLREPLPAGCRIVVFCRSERIHLLQPSPAICQLELDPFSEQETLVHLRQYFPEATCADGLEFHRLSNNGNPRVQAYALRLGFGTIAEVLTSLGPTGTSVVQQIEAQLDAAISSVKELFPPDFQSHIDSICQGLATLPPFIPVHILAKAAEVDEAAVRSFATSIGRPLWISATSVQFRDEPTETWFRTRFSATPDQIASYIVRLKPLACGYPYVAETLPSLLLQAGEYDELIDLALSDRLLPEHNPIDERNARVHRLQFAFKAALKLERYVDATSLALRAGEEVAGDRRQLELLRRNVDLVAPLQSEQRVQELAFRRLLRSEWDGSENVYAASLLSSVDALRGEVDLPPFSGGSANTHLT